MSHYRHLLHREGKAIRAVPEAARASVMERRPCVRWIMEVRPPRALGMPRGLWSCSSAPPPKRAVGPFLHGIDSVDTAWLSRARRLRPGRREGARSQAFGGVQLRTVAMHQGKVAPRTRGLGSTKPFSS